MKNFLDVSVSMKIQEFGIQERPGRKNHLVHSAHFYAEKSRVFTANDCENAKQQISNF